MIYQNRYCQGRCVNLRPCHTPPCNFPCPTFQDCCQDFCHDCCQNCNDDLTMFLIGYMVGQRSCNCRRNPFS